MSVVINIGVLALQGAFEEHIDMLNKLTDLKHPSGKTIQVHACAIRLPQDIEKCHALVLPGGESTTMGKLAVRWGLIEPLKKWIADDKPIWGTCAGMILLAESASNGEDGGQVLVGGIQVEVTRNFFGRQVRSFEMTVSGPPGYKDDTPYNAIFIRAPAILTSNNDFQSKGIDILACIQYAASPEVTSEVNSTQEVVIAARKENILVTSFHPELTDDSRWHQYFVEVIALPRIPEAIVVS